MNYEKTKQKLKTLSDKELNDLIEIAMEEKASNRMQYTSNTTHTPTEQCRDLNEFFGNAWIH